MNVARNCCCGGQGACVKDCIWQTEIESGCCHKDDTLLLWCERPGYSNRTQYYCEAYTDPFGNPAGNQEHCCVTTQPGESPIQAIYHYYDCFFRAIAVEGDIAAISGKPEMCPPDGCRFDDSDPPAPTACNGYYDTSCDSFPPCGLGQSGCCSENPIENCVTCCACNDPGMNAWRRGRMGVKDIWKWVVEATCHKGGADLGSGPNCANIGGWSQCSRLGALGYSSHQMIAVVHFERWWRIAQDCDQDDRIYIPGPIDEGITFVNSDLVPKWWIFACSGVPLYAGDLIDAIRFGAITQQEADDLIADLGTTCGHPAQGTLKKLSDAGYLRANDWRDEQRAAYQELDARFPGEGYAAHVQSVSSMHTLGPFRKRMTFATVGTSAQPLLRKADVVASNPDLGPLQADGFIDFPGGTQDDYDYWCERQWVYFRGRPGGWSWAGWNAGATCSGDEITAILTGAGRGDVTCIEALTGGGRGRNPTLAACGCCNSEGELEATCVGCAEPDCLVPPFIPQCAPFSACNILAGKAYCEGAQFRFFKYEANTRLDAGAPPCCPGPECCVCSKVECLYTANSFLVGARRSRDSWLDSVPFTCRNEIPPLPVFNDWEAWARTHPVPKDPICDFISNTEADANSWCWGCGCQQDGDPPCPSSEYSDRACCGGLCPAGCDCDPTTYDPLEQVNASCAASDACPPHSTEGQIDCIGFTPDCTEGT